MTIVEQGWSTLLGRRNALPSLVLAGGVALHAVNVFLVTTMLPSIVLRAPFDVAPSPLQAPPGDGD